MRACLPVPGSADHHSPAQSAGSLVKASVIFGRAIASRLLLASHVFKEASSPSADDFYLEGFHKAVAARNRENHVVGRVEYPHGLALEPRNLRAGQRVENHLCWPARFGTGTIEPGFGEYSERGKSCYGGGGLSHLTAFSGSLPVNPYAAKTPPAKRPVVMSSTPHVAPSLQ